MEKDNQTTTDIIEFATFYVGDALCGIDIQKIQEINKLAEMTKVPQTPEYVLGILNLRGQIVTVIDLSKKLGLGEGDFSQASRNIIVNSASGHVGLLVRRIGDVVAADMNHRERPPANMGGIQGDFFSGVYKTETQLIGLLNMEKVLGIDD
jgi:purine-binding chemotaxis protein CheW